MSGEDCLLIGFSFLSVVLVLVIVLVIEFERPIARTRTRRQKRRTLTPALSLRVHRERGSSVGSSASTLDCITPAQRVSCDVAWQGCRVVRFGGPRDNIMLVLTLIHGPDK